MYFFFIDDSSQTRPSRHKMGSLLSIGALAVSSENVHYLESELNKICDSFGFPQNEEFKWSPQRELWMYKNLKDRHRKEFFTKIIHLIELFSVRIISVIIDRNCLTATNSLSNEEDIIRLFLERVQYFLKVNDSSGILIADRPSGGRSDENKFLSNSFYTLQEGTDYVLPDRISFNILLSPSKFVRLLQVADVITSSTLSFIAGEPKYSPPIFKLIKPLFFSIENRIGGIGLKLHPDFKYANLYHWLLDDSHFWRMNNGFPLPLKNRPFSISPNQY